VKAELQSGAVVPGGGDELQWTTVTSGKLWSIVEAWRVRRSRRRAERAEAWSSSRGGNGGIGSFAIQPETVGSGSRKSRGGSGLLQRASACASKGGERWGRRRLDLDRAEREQGERGPGLVRHTEGKGTGWWVRRCAYSSEGGRWQAAHGDGGCERR
jgi:hypothetical protein